MKRENRTFSARFRWSNQRSAAKNSEIAPNRYFFNAIFHHPTVMSLYLFMCWSLCKTMASWAAMEAQEQHPELMTHRKIFRGLRTTRDLIQFLQRALPCSLH